MCSASSAARSSTVWPWDRPLRPAPGPRRRRPSPRGRRHDPLTAATPQGLLATFSADRTRLGLLEDASPPSFRLMAPSSRRCSPLQDVVDPLKAALTDQPAVPGDLRRRASRRTWAATRRSSSRTTGSSSIRRSGSGTARDDRQELRQTLLELIADTNTWVLGKTFNVNPGHTQASCGRSRRRPRSTDPLMAPFQAS